MRLQAFYQGAVQQALTGSRLRQQCLKSGSRELMKRKIHSSPRFCAIAVGCTSSTFRKALEVCGYHLGRAFTTTAVPHISLTVPAARLGHPANSRVQNSAQEASSESCHNKTRSKRNSPSLARSSASLINIFLFSATRKTETHELPPHAPSETT